MARRMKPLIAMHTRFNVIAKHDKKVEGDVYTITDHIYCATFVRRVDAAKQETLEEIINHLRDRALSYSYPLISDAVVDAISFETRIPMMVKNPGDWMVLVLTVQYRSLADGSILDYQQIDRRDQKARECYSAFITGIELAPITEISLAIDPYEQGMYIKLIGFGSENI